MSDCIRKVLKSPTKNTPAFQRRRFTIGSISRVLSSTVIYLGAPLPVRSSHLLGSSRASLASSAVLLRIEFTAMDAFARHWVRSYRTFPPLLETAYTASGGLFLLHFSSDRSGRALPVILALRSPDFPHARPFGAAPRDCPTRSRKYCTLFAGKSQMDCNFFPARI